VFYRLKITVKTAGILEAMCNMLQTILIYGKKQSAQMFFLCMSVLLQL
jgi:hypothetical protein